MATSCSYMVSTKLSILGWTGRRKEVRNRTPFFISAQQQSDVKETDGVKIGEGQRERPQNQEINPKGTKPRPVEPQVNVKDKNMSREYGGQWLSCATRHVRIYAAYIDPETSAFDQSQMDKLTLILDPTDEFVWNPDTCNLVYSYFQELVDHYEVVSLKTIKYTIVLFVLQLEHVTIRFKYKWFSHTSTKIVVNIKYITVVTHINILK